MALMSVSCGVCVANIYYNQPLLGDFAADFRASPGAVGWVATAAQTGYGTGLLFFLPLGDIVERRRLVFTLILICAGLLAATAAAPNLRLLVLGHLLIGMTALAAQILIPTAVELAPAQERGRTVGMLRMGVLGGILLARTLAGLVGDRFGWRAMYGLAAVMMVVLAGLLRRGLPHRPPRSDLTYGRLMRSLGEVLTTQPRLWRPAAVGALSFATFTAFWTSLAFLMKEEFHRGATETGLFGVVGLAGALAAPKVGRLSDRWGPGVTVTVSLALVAAAFAVMWTWVAIPMLIVGVLLMDLGVQTVQVAEQGRVLALLPSASSRLNTLYMVARFGGGACGSAVGAFAWTHGRWPAVCAAALGLTAAALVVHLAGWRYEAANGAAAEATG